MVLKLERLKQTRRTEDDPEDTAVTQRAAMAVEAKIAFRLDRIASRLLKRWFSAHKANAVSFAGVAGLKTKGLQPLKVSPSGNISMSRE